MSESSYSRFSLVREAERNRISAGSIEAGFAAMNSVKPICSFVWEDPEYIEIDGSTIAVYQLGPEDGVPILSFHGNPGSGRGPHPTRELLEAENIRIVAFDAPGFGQSSRIEGLPFVHCANVAKGVVEGFGYEKVGVFARSGGVPRSLGFAALHPDYISNMILFAGLAPQDNGIDWQAGMTAHNQEIFGLAAQGMLQSVIERLDAVARMLVESDYKFMRELISEMSQYDLAMLEEQHDLFFMISLGQTQGLVGGVDGWAQYVLENRGNWRGFELSDVKAPTLILHGHDDPYTNIGHARWLYDNMANADLIEMVGGHFVNWLQIRRQLVHLRETHLQETGVKAFADYGAGIESAYKLANLCDNYE